MTKSRLPIDPRKDSTLLARMVGGWVDAVDLRELHDLRRTCFTALDFVNRTEDEPTW